MVFKADKVDFIKTDSVLEALVLEANLIKKHQPDFNTKEKDDKSFNYVVITKEDFPRILIVRGREIDSDKHSNILQNVRMFKKFGPFTNGGQLKIALKIIRKIFPFRDKCKVGQGKPCFNSQIGLCPCVCTGEISAKDYAMIIRHIILFFQGKKKELVGNLGREMRNYARNREFEKAGEIKKTIFALNHIRDVALIKDENVKANEAISYKLEAVRIEAYDVAHLAGKEVVGVMTVIEDGDIKKSDYRKFKIKQNTGVNDTGSLKEILERRLNHTEWPMPNLIVIDGGVAQKNTAERVVAGKRLSIPIVSVVKDEKHTPREILGEHQIISKYRDIILLANSEAHRFAIGYHRQTRGNVLW